MAGRSFHGLEQHFGWIGLLSFLVGMTIGFVALGFGLNGTPVARLWFYYLISAGWRAGRHSVHDRVGADAGAGGLELREQLVQDDLQQESELALPKETPVGAASSA